MALERTLERELIRKCREEGARFYEPLVRAYEGPALRVATGMLGDRGTAREAREAVWRALERLEDGQREVLVLKELEGFSYREIARVMGIPEGTVASRLYHARSALRDALEAMGVDYP